MGLFRRRKREKDSDRILKRIIAGLVIGGAIGSVIGSKMLEKHEKEEAGRKDDGKKK